MKIEIMVHTMYVLAPVERKNYQIFFDHMLHQKGAVSEENKCFKNIIK